MASHLSLLITFSLAVAPLLSQPPVPPPPTKEYGYTLITDRMPVLRECAEDFMTMQERNDCSNKIMLDLIYHHLRWPSLADCFEGVAVVSFLVQKDGRLTDFKVVRDPGLGAGAEALRAVKLMVQETTPWLPGRQGPKLRPVVVRMNLPVRFKHH
ncbi:MAG: hypothetical protein AAF840_14745 [Bacteroidota bacterium]